MNDLISEGYAEKVNDENVKNNFVWYLPHFAVFNEKSPMKTRPVFDLCRDV